MFQYFFHRPCCCHNVVEHCSTQAAQTREFMFQFVSMKEEEYLRGNKVPGARNDATTTLVAFLADGADKLGVGGGERRNVIRGVVLVGARHFRAAGDGCGTVGRVDRLDALRVAGVHDGRDVKEGRASEAAEGHLAKHARCVRGALVDRVEIADVAVGENLGCQPGAGDGQLGDLWLARVASEVNGTGGAVLVDELNGIGSRNGGREGE